MTGKVGGQVFSVHGEGERVILRNEEGERQEVDLVRPAMPEAQSEDGSPIPANEQPEDPERAPGTSPLDRLKSLWKGASNEPEE